MNEEIKLLKQEIDRLNRELNEFKTVYYKDNFNQLQVFRKDVQFLGTASFASLNPSTSFGLGVTPIVRQPSIADPAGGTTVDTEARSAINQILDLLDNYGFTL